MARLSSRQPATPVTNRLVDKPINQMDDDELQQKIDLLQGARQMSTAVSSGPRTSKQRAPRAPRLPSDDSDISDESELT